MSQFETTITAVWTLGKTKQIHKLQQFSFITTTFLSKTILSENIWICIFLQKRLLYLKFVFSKKATKIDEIFTDNLTLTTWCQIGSEDFVNFCGLLRKHELYYITYLIYVRSRARYRDIISKAFLMVSRQVIKNVIQFHSQFFFVNLYCISFCVLLCKKL